MSTVEKVGKTEKKLQAIIDRHGDIDLQYVINRIGAMDLYDQYWSMVSSDYIRHIKKLRKEGYISDQTGECIHYVYKYLREVSEYKR